MRTITEIKKIGKGQRYNLYLDDELQGIHSKQGKVLMNNFFKICKLRMEIMPVSIVA